MMTMKMMMMVWVAVEHSIIWLCYHLVKVANCKSGIPKAEV